MNNIEEKIEKALSQDIELPSDYKYIIRHTLRKRSDVKMKKNKIMKILATGCACVVITTSLVYAKDISNVIKNFFNHNKGMDVAIQEGYIDEPEMEYVNSTKTEISTTNTAIKVKNMLMDDHNLSFTFSIKIDDDIDISKIHDIAFPNMIITDENNKIIYCENREVFDKYCEKNNLQYEYLNFNENYINNGTNYYIKSKSLESHTLDVVYNFYTTVYSYPKSKKLYINLTQINISESERLEGEELVLNGNWNIEFDVSEKFYNRESFVYTVTNCSDDSIDITEACTYETGMTYEFTSKDKPIYDENDEYEVKMQKIDDFLDKNIVDYVDDEYIENENGEIFKPINDNNESSGTIYGISGDFKHWQTFDLTKNKATDKLKIHFKLTLQGKTRDVVIELERKS